MERYLKVLKSYRRFPLEMERKLLDNVQPIAVKKHEFIQPDGAVNDCLYFVEKGLFHLFGETDGEQITHRFKKEDEFIIALKFIFANAPSIGKAQRHWRMVCYGSFPAPLFLNLWKSILNFRFKSR